MPLVSEVANGLACRVSVAKTARASFRSSISSVMAPCSAPMASSAGNATDAGTPAAGGSFQAPEAPVTRAPRPLANGVESEASASD